MFKIRLRVSIPNVECIELGIKTTDFLNSPSAGKAIYASNRIILTHNFLNTF